MASLLSIEKYFLFLLFFIPGFISIKVYHLFVAGSRVDFSKSFYDALGYSSFNLAFFSWLIYFLFHENYVETHTFLFYAIFFIIVFIAPIFWPVLFVWLTEKTRLSRHLVIGNDKSPWDHFFKTRETCWVIVTLKNGNKIGGKYGLASFASSFPRKHSIYISEVYKLDSDGKFTTEKITRSKGIIILPGEMSTVEFFS
jgi:hypothetical protein